MSLKNKMLALALGVTASFSVATAQDAPAAPVAENDGTSGLQLGIGISYRNFHKANFRANNAGSYSGWYENGDIATLQPGAPDLEKILPSGSIASYQYNVINASWSGSTGNAGYNFTDKIAPILSASYAFYFKDSITLSAVANFQYNMLDASERGGQAGGNDATILAFRYGTEPVTSAPTASSSTSFMSASSKYKFDMDLYTLDLGLRMDFAVSEQMNLFVAAGPSVSYADMDSSFRGGLYGNNTALATFRASDSSEDWVFGYYASAGAAFWFNEQIGASLEARYDGAFEDAETQLVTQSLDTWGAAVKLLYRF
ncbi:MAG: hypothetical protein GX927_02405 [Lentisphaerae bacterium]|nr:hypothetical protein [Lentisphaerota bacterium]